MPDPLKLVRPVAGPDIQAEKRQALARSILSGLFMLVRSAKIYEADHALFERPLNVLRQAMNDVVLLDGRLELLAVADNFQVNGNQVRIDSNGAENLRYLIAELRARGVTGVALTAPVPLDDLRKLLLMFGRKALSPTLAALRLLRTSTLQDALPTESATPAAARNERKHVGLTLYARALHFARRTLESVAAGEPADTQRALPLVQELVDLCGEQRAHMLGLTALRDDEDFLAFHHVNVCLLALLLGDELGLTRPQLRDLGYIALFHDAGMAALPPPLLTKVGALSPQERATVRRVPSLSVSHVLRESSMTRATLNRVVTTYELAKEPTHPGSGVFARIIAICHAYDALTSRRSYRDPYTPDVALMLMFTELRGRFDAELLQVFMRLVAVDPVRVVRSSASAD